MRIRTGLAVAALATALSAPAVLVAASPASAAPSSASLAILPSAYADHHRVLVSGHFDGSSSYSLVTFSLKGDDGWATPDLGFTRNVVAVDGDFSYEALVHRSVLDEDYGVLNTDEVFARVTSPGDSSLRTNTVLGKF
ncbi:hypothetical protein [Motilibacter deserti]|uniref:Beta/gamma crystallin n=1 Tax=Motilibacter deserti TaxID=2714956 RepID=A0ABX0GYK5_9ACTN|nr:hypothetical protein [Motilibacter deserti]NHC15668.1 hypothetical protein [Motilibacter deserti]